MAYTGHGHHIPGTNKGEGVTKVKSVTSCGGVNVCPRCRTEVEDYTATMLGTGFDHPGMAKDIVYQYVGAQYVGRTVNFEVYVVWFAYILGGWKALLSTTLDDGMYYEVTRNAQKRETYLDAYKKAENRVIPD